MNRLHEILASGIGVMVVANCGFGDQALFSYLDTIGWGYAIRFKRGTTVTHDGTSKPAGEWVPPSGHAKMLRAVQITQDKTAIGAVVLKHQKGMKELWCIATNRPELGAAEIVRRYSRRFTIEETFRDIKDAGSSLASWGSSRRRASPSWSRAPSRAALTGCRGPRRIWTW